MPIINEPRIRPASDDDAALDAAVRASAAERSGEWVAADTLYAETFHGALRRGQSERATDALRGQARMRLQQGRHEEAEELVELSLEIARLHRLEPALAKGLNVLGLVRHAQRDSLTAQELFGRALEMALDQGDDELVGLACQNLGVLANLRGDYHEARSRYLEGVGSFVRSGSTANAMLAYNNLGSASADLREWLEAEVYFTRGIEIAERLSHTPSTGMLYSNLAEPLIHVGELERARDALDRAEAAARQVNDQATLADVARFRALLARAQDDLPGADAHLARALDAAAEFGLYLEHAEALRELAEVRARQGRADEALVALRDAERLFDQLGMEADAAGAAARGAELAGGMD